MHLTLVIPSLACGGVERVVATMANYWAACNHKVTVLTFDDGGEPPFFPLSSNVRHIPLALNRDSSNAAKALRNNFRLIRTLRSYIHNSHPDIVISFLTRTNVRTLLAAFGLNVPVIVSERADPKIENPGRIWKLLRRLTYRSASGIVAHTRASAAYLSQLLKLEVADIPNPVCVTSDAHRSPTPGKPTIVAAGRLELEKGYDVLIESFSRVAHDIEGLTLRIFGDGAERTKLESLRSQLGLDSRVSLPGQTREISSALDEATLFIAPSRFEGFGNSICEAMARGIPVIASDCSGPREIITPGTDGVLVPIEDVEALAAEMARLLKDIEERQRLGNAASQIRNRFSLESVMDRWDALITRCTTAQ